MKIAKEREAEILPVLLAALPKRAMRFLRQQLCGA
jgi:hypothetical protein